MKLHTLFIFLVSLFFSSVIYSQCLNTSHIIYDVQCSGGTDGAINITPLNGQSPYTYDWSTGSITISTNHVISGLSVGAYQVTVSDNIGCDTIFNFIITEPTPIFSSIIPTDPNCFGGCDGAITFNSSGGTGAHTYSIDNGITFHVSPNFLGLCTGQYIAIVKDANGCTNGNGVPITLSGPPPIAVTINGNAVLCSGQSNILSSSVSGGTPAYNYIWNTGSVTADVTALVGGNYCLTVTDVSGCMDSFCLTVTLDTFDAYIDLPSVISNENVHVFLGNSLQIQTYSTDPSNTAYDWHGGYIYAYLNNLNIGNPISTPTQFTNLPVAITHTTTGCIVYDTMSIQVFNNDPTDTIHVQIAPDSTISACSTYPAFISGTSGSSNPLGSLNYGSYTATHPYGCLGYISNGVTPEVTDTVMWVNCEQLCDTTIFIVTTASCVWPGDTDDDGIVNNFDLLPIGLHSGTAGNVRANASINYNCQPSLFWGTGTSGNPTVDIKHIDCDGNGSIHPIDTNAIILNWAQTHQKSSNSFSAGIDIYIDTTVTNPGDTISLPIILGNSGTPSNGYGIAFTINYDPLGVDTGSVSIDFSTSWLGNLGTDLIGIYKDFYDQGEVEVGMTRIDQNTISGGGTIGYINLTIKDDVLPKSAFVRLDFDITDVRFIDSVGNVIPTTPLPSQILVVNDATSTQAIHKEQTDLQIQAFPNPTSGELLIRSQVEPIESIQIFDLMGKMIFEKQAIGNKQDLLELNHLANGVYLIQVRTPKGIKSMKVIKQ